MNNFLKKTVASFFAIAGLFLMGNIVKAEIVNLEEETKVKSSRYMTTQCSVNTETGEITGSTVLETKHRYFGFYGRTFIIFKSDTGINSINVVKKYISRWFSRKAEISFSLNAGDELLETGYQLAIINTGGRNVNVDAANFFNIPGKATPPPENDDDDYIPWNHEDGLALLEKWAATAGGFPVAIGPYLAENSQEMHDVIVLWFQDHGSDHDSVWSFLYENNIDLEDLDNMANMFFETGATIECFFIAGDAILKNLNLSLNEALALYVNYGDKMMPLVKFWLDAGYPVEDIVQYFMNDNTPRDYDSIVAYIEGEEVQAIFDLVDFMNRKDISMDQMMFVFSELQKGNLQAAASLNLNFTEYIELMNIVNKINIEELMSML
jgi:hypothetical protein